MIWYFIQGLYEIPYFVMVENISFVMMILKRLSRNERVNCYIY